MMAMRMPDARRWAQLSPALDDLLELSPDAQSAWLASLDGTDPALAHELRTLLQAGQRSASGALLGGEAGLAP